jgi:hypothetical protein
MFVPRDSAPLQSTRVQADAGQGRVQLISYGTLYSDPGIYGTLGSFFEKFLCISAGKQKRADKRRWEAREISELRVRILLGSVLQHIEIIGKNRGTEIALVPATIE